MGNRRSQFNMAHTLPAYGGFCNLHAAAVTDYAFVTDFFIFSTMTFPVLGGPENTFTEQAVLFRLQSPVVNSLRLLHFTMGPLPDFLRRGQTDLNRIECHRLISGFFIYCFRHLITPFVRSTLLFTAVEALLQIAQKSFVPVVFFLDIDQLFSVKLLFSEAVGAKRVFLILASGIAVSFDN